jgi:hypothetical protein
MPYGDPDAPMTPSPNRPGAPRQLGYHPYPPTPKPPDVPHNRIPIEGATRRRNDQRSRSRDDRQPMSADGHRSRSRDDPQHEQRSRSRDDDLDPMDEYSPAYSPPPEDDRERRSRSRDDDRPV